MRSMQRFLRYCPETTVTDGRTYGHTAAVPILGYRVRISLWDFCRYAAHLWETVQLIGEFGLLKLWGGMSNLYGKFSDWSSFSQSQFALHWVICNEPLNCGS